jgi:hypothetical protein
MRPRNKFFHSTHFPHICPSLEDDKWIVCFADTRMRKRESVCFSFILPHPKTLNQALYVAKFLTCYPYIYRNGSLVCWGRCLGGGRGWSLSTWDLGVGSWVILWWACYALPINTTQLCANCQWTLGGWRWGFFFECVSITPERCCMVTCGGTHVARACSWCFDSLSLGSLIKT